MENTDFNNEEVEIDLQQIFVVLLSRAVVIVLVGIVFALAAFLGSKFLIKPVYESQTSLYVLNQQNSGTTTYSDLQSSTQLTKDYMILVTSRTVTEKVIAELNLDMTNEELAESITVNTPSDSRVLEITVKNNDQYKAKAIADKVAEVSATSICEIMSIEKVNVFEEANVAEYPASPNCTKNAIIAFIAGFVLAAAIVIIRFIMNDTINTAEDVEKYLGISTLALIPLSEGLDDSDEFARKKKKPSKARKERK